MEDRASLPPLLGSDDKTLKENRYDSFYKKRPSDVWTGSIERIERQEVSKCDHYFIPETDGVRCKLCSMGLSGTNLVIKDGKLYFNDQKIL